MGHAHFTGLKRRRPRDTCLGSEAGHSRPRTPYLLVAKGEPRSPIVDAGPLHMHHRPRAASSRRQARLWVARETRARDGAGAAFDETRTADSANGRRVSGAGGVNRRSDRQGRSARTLPSVANHLSASASADACSVANAAARPAPVEAQKHSSRQRADRRQSCVCGGVNGNHGRLRVSEGARYLKLGVGGRRSVC